MCTFNLLGSTDDRFEKHMDILFMITHDGNFNTAIQALILIYQVAISKQVFYIRDDFKIDCFGSLLSNIV